MNEAASTEARAGGNEAIVARNAMILIVGQVASIPLSILFNAVLARQLGPRDFGYYYLAGTFASFGFIFVEFGMWGPVPAQVSTNRSRAGELLGSGLVWRTAASIVVCAVLFTISSLLRYGREFQMALALVSIITFIASITSSLHAVVRGFERTDVAAYANVGQQLVNVALVIPVLLAGGGLPAALATQAAGSLLVVFFVWRAFRSITRAKISFRSATLRDLLVAGSAFLLFEVALVLQPSIDAALLGKLAPVEVTGWYGVSRKLVGVLLVPVVAVTSALYPTMCRLFATDRPAMNRLLGSSLRSVTVLVVPVALGCALYPEIGVRIFGGGSFGPAAANLRILSIFVFLVYFSMTLGTFIVAAGRQRAWALVQAMCVVVSLALDPVLIPWFQTRTGNGGMGVCVASVASEVLMVGVGIWMLPREIFDRALFRGLGLTVVAGLAMVTAARLLSGIPMLVAAPLSLVAFVACLWIIGGLDKGQTQMLNDLVLSKLRRQR